MLSQKEETLVKTKNKKEKEEKKSSRPESNQRPLDYRSFYSRALYQLSYERFHIGSTFYTRLGKDSAMLLLGKCLTPSVLRAPLF